MCKNEQKTQINEYTLIHKNRCARVSVKPHKYQTCKRLTAEMFQPTRKDFAWRFKLN